MAKRKNDCNLYNVVKEYLKKQKFEKTLELFDSRNDGNKDVNSAMLANFANFLKQRDRKNQNGAFQPIKKVEIYLKHKYRNNIFNEKSSQLTLTFSFQSELIDIRNDQRLLQNRKNLSFQTIL